MTQRTLFNTGTGPRTDDRRTQLPAPWRRVDGGNTKTTARYAHPKGYEIHHCGHPTANWPYALYLPDGRLCVGVNGYAFRTSALAALDVDRIMAGGAPRVHGGQ